MRADLPGPKHWLDAERLRVYPRLFLFAYVAIGLIWVLLSRHGVDPSGKPLGYDFITFWSASRLVLDGEAVRAYDLASIVSVEHAVVAGIKTIHPWQYPPTYLLAVSPLAWMPYWLAFALFVGASLAGLALAVRRILPRAGVLPLLFAFPAVMVNAFHGQNGFLTAALIGAGLLSLERRPLLAGLCFGLLTIKPHLGLLIPLALIAGCRWRALASAVLCSAAFLGLSLVVLGADTLPAFFERIPQVSRWVANNQLPLVKMPTFFAEALRLGVPLPWAYALHGAVALIAAASVVWLWRSGASPALRYAGLCTGSLLMPPYLFDYDLVWLALPLAWFAADALATGWQPGERNLLALAWLCPLLVGPLAVVLRFEPSPLILLALHLAVLRRARHRRPAAVAQSASAKCT